MIFCDDLAKSIATWRAVLSSKDTRRSPFIIPRATATKEVN